MLQVKLNKNNENPFYGLKNCLSLYQNGSKGIISETILQSCWEEVKDDKTKRELFFVLLFSIGDITARQHNIFKIYKNVDSGGNSQRSAFLKIYGWLRGTYLEQFKQFLFARLFNEYTSFDTILSNRVITQKKTTKVIGGTANLSGSREYLDILSDFVASIINGNNPTDKYFLAKFLTRPRPAKRKKHKQMLAATKNLMRQREFFLKLVSDKAKLRYVKKETHIEFHGYYEWRKEYIGSLESVLFSSKKILEFDKQEFLDWLGKLPASARHRVRCRLLTKDNKLKAEAKTNSEQGSKWINLGQWFLEWESFKDKKQSEVRVLEEQLRQISFNLVGEKEELQDKLKKAKKEAKVTTGAINFADMFKEIIQGSVDKLKIQPFLDKVKLPYNTLTFIDDSSSMSSSYGDQGFTAFDFATFIATITLMKNPDDTGRSLIGMYSNVARMFTSITAKDSSSNRFMRPVVTTINEPLIVPEQHFLDNLERIRGFARAMRTGNGTNIASIPDHIYRWVNGDAALVEQLQQFPVWTIVSDGNWNNMNSPEASMNDFMMRCQRYFGFKPFIVAIDVAYGTSAAISKFQGIENFMFIPPNPAQIEQLLTNFKDMDILDVYTPLQSLYRSNRYDLVKANTL